MPSTIASIQSDISMRYRGSGWSRFISPATATMVRTCSTLTIIRFARMYGRCTSMPCAVLGRFRLLSNGTTTSRSSTSLRRPPKRRADAAKPCWRRRACAMKPDLKRLQILLYRAITEGPDGGLGQDFLLRMIRGDERLSASERIAIYANAYFYRLLDCLRDDFPATGGGGCFGVRGARARLPQALSAHRAVDLPRGALFCEFSCRTSTACALAFFIRTRQARKDAYRGFSWPGCAALKRR